MLFHFLLVWCSSSNPSFVIFKQVIEIGRAS
jgi:hypothetical protein